MPLPESVEAFREGVLNLIDDLRGYAAAEWDWKYGKYWDQQRADIKATFDRRIAIVRAHNDAKWAALRPSAPAPASPAPRDERQIKHMVQRFLGWRLPENFQPDAGISFKRTFNEHTAHPMKHEPTGTNLFDATQAEAMIRYMLDGYPAPSPSSSTTPEYPAVGCVRGPLERLTPDELAKIPPLAPETLEAALEQGQRDRDALESGTQRVPGRIAASSSTTARPDGRHPNYGKGHGPCEHPDCGGAPAKTETP